MIIHGGDGRGREERINMTGHHLSHGCGQKLTGQIEDVRGHPFLARENLNQFRGKMVAVVLEQMVGGRGVPFTQVVHEQRQRFLVNGSGSHVQPLEWCSVLGIPHGG